MPSTGQRTIANTWLLLAANFQNTIFDLSLEVWSKAKSVFWSSSFGNLLRNQTSIVNRSFRGSVENIYENLHGVVQGVYHEYKSQLLNQLQICQENVRLSLIALKLKVSLDFHQWQLKLELWKQKLLDKSIKKKFDKSNKIKKNKIVRIHYVTADSTNVLKSQDSVASERKSK